MKEPEYAVVTSRQAKNIPYPYVYAEDDGSYRELDLKDQEYLEEKFHPADGARPYVKRRYKDLTPDGKLGEFLQRSRLPKNLKPGEVPIPKKWWRFW